LPDDFSILSFILFVILLAVTPILINHMESGNLEGKLTAMGLQLPALPVSKGIY
jgi:hypothetical protein